MKHKKFVKIVALHFVVVFVRKDTNSRERFALIFMFSVVLFFIILHFLANKKQYLHKNLIFPSRQNIFAHVPFYLVPPGNVVRRITKRLFPDHAFDLFMPPFYSVSRISNVNTRPRISFPAP